MTGQPNNMTDDMQLDRRQVRRAFERAARHYDAAAVLQHEVRGRLLERLDLVGFTPEAILDAGAGTGTGAAQLLKRYRRARVVALDIATPMLREARRRKPWFRAMPLVCADAAALPLADESTDLIFSNLMLQWCDDLDRVFREFRRILRPRGLIIFSTFGPDTLREMRAAWRSVDGYSHVNRFIDMHDIGDALVRAELAEPVMDVEHLTLTYEDVFGLMRDLKSIGAHNVLRGRHHGLTGKSRMQAFAAAYEQFRQAGKLPATYEVVYGTAWAPAATPGRAMARQGGVSVERLRKSLRKK